MWTKKEIQKKKQGERGKAKAIPIKDNSLENKVKIVKELEKELPKNNEEKDNKWPGRRTVMTQSAIDKLKLCFSVGMTDEQSCYFCQISTDALYKYQRENPEFIKEKEILKESITMQARVNVWRSIKTWNVWDSWKWLEKKDSSFIPKMQFAWDIKVEMTETQKKKEQKLLDKLKGFIWS